MILELCTDSIEAVRIASKQGFKRVELCAALELGGISPGIGLIQEAAAIEGIEIHPIIRPRSGGFNYSNDEFQVMKHDIISAAQAGAVGVVFGILNPDNTIDLERNRFLRQLAASNGLEATFHRAFDMCLDPFVALEQIIQLGFDRILSSGQENKAIEGKACLLKMVNQSAGRIQIMAGSGVNGANAKSLQEIGVDALHFTARKQKVSSGKLDMGPEYEMDMDKIQQIFKVI